MPRLRKCWTQNSSPGSCCRKVVEDENDVTYCDGDYYGENVGHDDCMTDIYLSE